MRTQVLPLGRCSSYATLAFLAVVSFMATAPAQAQSPPIQAGAAAGPLRVALACDACDLAALQRQLAFVDVIEDAAKAEVDVTIRTRPVSPETRGLITFTGRGRFAGVVRRIPFRIRPGLTDAQARNELTRVVKLGLVEFAASTPNAAHLSITFERPGAAEANPAQRDQRDPWHYWVFRTSANAFLNGEASTSGANYYLSASANRTTDLWKVRVAVSRSLNRSSFTLDDGQTIESRLTDWNVESLVVRSLGQHWSVGLTSAMIGSTYSNSNRVVRMAPGIEYDVFPYSESSRRSLTLRYSIGGAHYDYEAETIFGKLREAVAEHGLNVSLGLRQPWGQAGASLVYTQQLQAPERWRTTLGGNINLRLIRSLTLNTSASYARIRDQFTLEKGDATDDEVLLRQRQLATGYRYSFSLGLGYSFGALSNTTVNPRFGG